MAQNAKIVRGEVVGYICKQCNEVKKSMWDDTCNSCIKMNKKDEKLLKKLDNLYKAILELKEEIRSLK